MKWCVNLPEETVLIIRPCLTAICMGNKPAAKLLSVLLYRKSIRKEHQSDAENINEVKSAQGKIPDQDTSLRIYRSQAQLIDDMCGEVVDKTLHDTAIPCLQLLGYLDIEDMPGKNCYDLHLEPIEQALSLYKVNSKKQPQLEKFLIRQIQLEKFLIDMERDQLEKFLINKKNFVFLLEKVLIANRESSNCKRGRKPRSEAASSGNSEKPQIDIEIDIEIIEEDNAASAANTPSPSSQSNHDEPSVTETSTVAPDVAPTPSESVEVKQPETPIVTPPNVESGKTTRSRNTRKSKLATLETFDFEQEVTIESIMSLGDCWRGAPLIEVKRADSDYQKALQAATVLFQRPRGDGRHGYTLKEINSSYRYYKRITEKDKPTPIADDWWKGRPTDLWVIAKNIDAALQVIAPPQSSTSTEQKRVAPLIKTAEETKAYLDEVEKQVGPKTQLSLDELMKKYSTKNKPQEERVSL